MIGFANINGQDAYTTYGISFRPGTYAELLKAPKRKVGYEYNWGDEDGIETDPNEVPVFERQTYNLPIYLEASSESAFYLKYNALRSFLLNAKEFQLDFLKMGRRFKVRYADMSSFQNLTRINGNNKVGCYITIQLTDDYPTNSFAII